VLPGGCVALAGPLPHGNLEAYRFRARMPMSNDLNSDAGKAAEPSADIPATVGEAYARSKPLAAGAFGSG